MSIQATRPNISMKILSQTVSHFREVDLDGLIRLQAVAPELPPFNTSSPNYDHLTNLSENRYLEYRAFNVCDLDTMASIEILQRKASQGDVDAAHILMRKAKHYRDKGDLRGTRLESMVIFLSNMDFNNLLAHVQPQQLVDLSILIQDAYFYFNNRNGIELLIAQLEGTLTAPQLRNIHALCQSILPYTFVSEGDKQRLIQALQAKRAH